MSLVTKVLDLLDRSQPLVCVGFGLTRVAASHNVIVNAAPQMCAMKPVGLIVPDEASASFMINDFKIGMRSQFASAGAIPAAAFSPRAVRSALKFDVVQVGQFVTLDVTNIIAPGPSLPLIEMQPPHVAVKSRGMTKKAFELLREDVQRRSRATYQHNERITAYNARLQQQAARDFSAMLFCVPLDVDPHDGWWHLLQIARRAASLVHRDPLHHIPPIWRR